MDDTQATVLRELKGEYTWVGGFWLQSAFRKAVGSDVDLENSESVYEILRQGLAPERGAKVIRALQENTVCSRYHDILLCHSVLNREPPNTRSARI